MIIVTRLRPGKGKIKAFCDIEIDERFGVKGFRVVDNGKGGYFIGLPNQKGEDDKNYAMFIPREPLKSEIEKIVLDAYLNFQPDNKDISETAVRIARQLHDGERRILGKVVSKCKEGRVSSYTQMSYRFVTQDPKKDNKWGKLAKEGHEITWIIRNDTEHIGKVIDGVFHNS